MNTATAMVAISGHDPNLDRELWRRWSGGDTQAGELLSRRLLPSVRSFFMSKVGGDTVHDLVQEVWLALGETQHRRGLAEFGASVRAYVLGIARHVLFRHLRRKYKDELLDPVDSSIAQLEPSLSQAIGRKLLAQRMMHALQRLPVDSQILLELRYVQELTNPEIAALYEIPEGTVKSRLARARRMLDEQLRGG